MNVKSFKKGFTLTELIIVIVIIGILAGVLIPTFINVVNKANKAADLSLIRNLNEALTIDKLEKGEHKNMTQALEAAEKFGYLVDKINAKSSKNEILWDSENDVFCYLVGDKLEYYPKSVKDEDALDPTDPDEKYLLWIIASTPSDVYSTYLYEAKEDSFTNVKTGIDVGKETVSSIEYKGTGTPQNVVIRTNSASTTLTIDDASTGTIYHYGSAGALNIIQCHTSSYHENGNVGYAQIAKGRIVLEKGSNIAQIHLVKKDNESFDSIVIAKDNTVLMPEFSRDDVVIGSNGTLVVALQEGTEQEATKDYVWLTMQGVYEQIKVSDNESSSGNVWVNTSNKSEETKAAALQIANNIENSVTIDTETYTVSVDSTTRELVFKDSNNDVVNDPNIINSVNEVAIEKTGLTVDPMNVSSLEDFLALCGSATSNGYTAPKTNFMRLTNDIDISHASKNGAALAGGNMLAIGSLDLNGHTLTTTNFCITVRVEGSTISNGKIESATGLGFVGTEKEYASYVLIVGADYVTLENITTIGGVSFGEGESQGEYRRGANYGVVNNCNLRATRFYGLIAQAGSSVTMNGGSVTRYCDSTSVSTGITLVYSSTPADWGVGTNVMKFIDVKVDRANPFSSAYGAGTTITQINDTTWLLNGQSSATVK